MLQKHYCLAVSPLIKRAKLGSPHLARNLVWYWIIHVVAYLTAVAEAKYLKTKTFELELLLIWLAAQPVLHTGGIRLQELLVLSRPSYKMKYEEPTSSSSSIIEINNTLQGDLNSSLKSCAQAVVGIAQKKSLLSCASNKAPHIHALNVNGRHHNNVAKLQGGPQVLHFSHRRKNWNCIILKHYNEARHIKSTR